MSEKTPKLQNDNALCDELRQLLPGYVTGAADTVEVARIQQLLGLCPETQQDISEYAHLLTGFYERVNPVQPPANLHDQLMSQLRSSGATTAPIRPAPTMIERRRTGNTRLISWVMTAAAVILLVVSNLYWLDQIESAQSEIVFLRQRQQQVIEFASARELQRVALVDAASDTAMATLFWHATGMDALLTSANLPRLSSNHTYQLWMLDGDQPVSAGVFAQEASGVTAFRIQLPSPATSYSAVAISVEPAGGSLALSAAPIAVGEIATSQS